MKVTSLAIPDVLLFEPEARFDRRGFFLESFNLGVFARATGLDVAFLQDNRSRSSEGVLRGLHYQIRQPQGKLVSVICGTIFTVAVDLRRSSTTFARWVSAELSGDNLQQLWIPPGFAHGFLVVAGSADVHYKVTDYYAPQFERCIAWDDAELSIDWPLQGRKPLLSSKDAAGVRSSEAEVY